MWAFYCVWIASVQDAAIFSCSSFHTNIMIWKQVTQTNSKWLFYSLFTFDNDHSTAGKFFSWCLVVSTFQNTFYTYNQRGCRLQFALECEIVKTYRYHTPTECGTTESHTARLVTTERAANRGSGRMHMVHSINLLYLIFLEILLANEKFVNVCL